MMAPGSLSGLATLAAVFSVPAQAQEEQRESPSITAEEAIETARLLYSVEAPEVDSCADANSNADVIVVCREVIDPERFMFERPRERPVGADVRDTSGGAPRAPDFDESCLHNNGRANCLMVGGVAPPTYMVDFDALPETPAGSDAARRYGGPTDAERVAERAAAEAQVPDDEADIGTQTQAGIDDDIYGP